MRAPTPFVSTLGPVIARYVAVKQALGRRFETAHLRLAAIDRFLAGMPPGDLTPETFAAWGASMVHLAASTRRQRFRLAYNLCRFRRRDEPTCFLPDPSQFPPPQPRPRPYIFSDGEIVQLLRATDGLEPHAPSPLHGHVARLAVVLLYTTGLRRQEVVRLTLRDYDVDGHVLLVRETKFYKSRLVPLSADATVEIDRYLRERRRSGFPCDGDAPLLLHHHGGLAGYTGSGLGDLLRKLFRTTGIRTPAGRSPRVHDLRFTFAVQAMRRWYRAGVDVQARLPALAAYLGHASLVSTQYYLTCLDAVVEAASERFHKQCDRILRGTSLAGGGR